MSWHQDDLKNSLVGKTIRSFEYDSDSITFDTDAGKVRWVVAAECCSLTWIEALDLSLCFGKPVTDVTEDELPESWYAKHPEPEEQGGLRLYGITIKTPGGSGTIDFRNESNGYYGGAMAVAR